MDHPRSRGVYRESFCQVKPQSGSSPLARGLRVHRRHTVRRGGIIPARAGFTAQRREEIAPGADHPRSRGVYRYLQGSAGGLQGSSPLARGLRRPVVRLLRLTGIIPARAGFTPTRTCSARGGGDHPRSRGVYGRSLVCAWLTVGSSPLARGLLIHRPVPEFHVRIIPARAGFTPSTRVTFPSTRDHPRSRGVYWTGAAPITMWEGSSPLARGLRLADTASPHDHGIIPARAGFTSQW